jgi:hypothetical protein
MRATNVMDAYSMSLQRQERELSVNLRGRAARDYACGNLALSIPVRFLRHFLVCNSFPGLTKSFRDQGCRKVARLPARKTKCRLRGRSWPSPIFSCRSPPPPIIPQQRRHVITPSRRWRGHLHRRQRRRWTGRFASLAGAGQRRRPASRSSTSASACTAATARMPGYAARFAAPAATVNPPAVHNTESSSFIFQSRTCRVRS